jgi:hypothetical protein
MGQSFVGDSGLDSTVFESTGPKSGLVFRFRNEGVIGFTEEGTARFSRGVSRAFGGLLFRFKKRSVAGNRGSIGRTHPPPIQI